MPASFPTNGIAEMSEHMLDPGLRSFVDDRDRLISIACRIVDSQAVAEELVQESWLRWDARSYPPDQATPIFRSIVANLARDWRRRHRTEAAITEALPEAGDDTGDAERIVIAREELRKITRALQELDPRVVTAFRLHRIEGLTMAQIAVRLDTVPSRVHAYVVKALTHVTCRLMD